MKMIVLNILNNLIPFMLVVVMVLVNSSTKAQDKDLMIRVARITVDPAQLENYKAALKEGIETAVRVEPGVITLYAVYDKEHPANVTVFEIYASGEAYQSHIETPHFKKYKTTTQDMVRSLELIDVTPIALSSKMK